MKLSIDLDNKDDIKSALHLLKHYFEGFSKSVKDGDMNTENTAPEKVAKPDAPEKKTAEKPETEQPKEIESDAPEVTKETLQKLMKDLMQAKKRDAVIMTLHEVGVHKLSELSADGYPLFYKKLKELV